MHTTRGELDLDLVVVGKELVAEDICVLTMSDARGLRLPEWSPGSHVDLELGPDIVRQYSLHGDPADRSAWRVAVLLEPESRGGSTYVHSAVTAGTTVRARGPRNNFHLVVADRYTFVAGGIGITPLLPMIREVHTSGADWQLVYGGRRRTSMAFCDELEQTYGDRVRVLPEDVFGLLPLDQVVGAAAPGTAVYCCGPESLILAVEELHVRQDAWTLHVERFSPRDVQPASTGTFEVEAVRSGLVVGVEPDISVLEALTSAGVRILQSCTEGLCGTCETAVLKGLPDHRDSILSAEERAANDTMYVCVSRSLSPRLVLDL